MMTHEQYVRALAPHFIDEIVEEARLISIIASDSGIPWRDLVRTNYDIAAELEANLNCVEEDSVAFNFESIDMIVLTSTSEKEDRKESSDKNTMKSSIQLCDNIPVDEETMTIKSNNELDLIFKSVDVIGAEGTLMTKQINPDLIAVFRQEFERISDNKRGVYLNKTYDIMPSKIFEPECSEAKCIHYSEHLVSDDIEKNIRNEPMRKDAYDEGNVTKKDEKGIEIFDNQKNRVCIPVIDQKDNTNIMIVEGNEMGSILTKMKNDKLSELNKIKDMILTSMPEGENQNESSDQNTTESSIHRYDNVPVEEETMTIKNNDNELDFIFTSVDIIGSYGTLTTKQIHPDLIAAFRNEFERMSDNKRGVYSNKTYEIIPSKIFEPECSEVKCIHSSEHVVSDDIDKNIRNETMRKASYDEGNVTEKDEKDIEIFDNQEHLVCIAAVDQKDNTNIMIVEGNEMGSILKNDKMKNDKLSELNKSKDMILTSTPEKEDQKESSDQNSTESSIQLSDNIPVDEETMTIKSNDNELDLIFTSVDIIGEDGTLMTNQINPDLIAAFRYEFERISDINERGAYLNKTFDIMASKIFEPECSEAKYVNSSEPIVSDDIDKNKQNEPTSKEPDDEGNVTIKDEDYIEVFDHHESHVCIAKVDQEDNTNSILIVQGNEMQVSELPQETAFGLLEKTFFTLNRDEEPSSEVESSETSERLTMHEVELLMHGEELNSEQESNQEEEELSQLVPKNDTFTRRIRTQGMRLFSWIRALLRKSALIGRNRKQRKRTETQSRSAVYMPEERVTQWKYEFKMETDSSEGIWKSKDDLSKKKGLETEV